MNEVDIKVTATGGSKAASEIERPKGAAQNLQNAISGIGSTARGLLAADLITQIGETAKRSFTSATTAASDLNESMNAVDRIFGESAGVIHTWGRTNANAFGLSERAFNQLVTPLGAGLRNAGIEMGKTSDLTLKLTERAADMASVFNTSVADALQAVQAALRGEADPIERYGVSVMDAAVTQEALAESGKKVASELTNQDKALARVNLILKQTNSVAGDFKATTDGLANSQRIAAAEIEEAKAKLGAGLMPILAEGARLLGSIAEGFSKLPAPVQTTTMVVLGLGAAFVFLAPKLLAARDAFKELNITWANSDTKMGRTIQGVTHFAGRLAVLAAAAQVASIAFSSDLNPQVEELAENLAAYAKKTHDAGEATRLFGDDFRYLKDNSYVFKDDFWTNMVVGITSVEEEWTGLSNTMDDSHKHTTERVQALDAALARLVQQGRAGEAKAAFEQLAAALKEAGVSEEQLRAGLPQYAAAQNAANRASTEATTVLQGQTIALKDLHDALRAQTDPLFALIEAQGNLTDAQKAYNKALADHGAKSPQAAEALRDLAKAGIELAGATNDAQGVFNGKLTPALRQVLLQAGATEAMIAQLEQQFKNATAAGDAFAKNYNATITVTTNKPKSKQERVDDAIDKLTGGRPTGGNASGVVRVAEHGDEIVDFNAGRVYNASQTAGLMSGQGWGGLQIAGMGQAAAQELHIYWHISGADREFVQFMKKIVDDEGGGSVIKAFSRQRYHNN